MNRILVATDGSPTSADAVRFAIDLASEHRSELIFVHVVPTVEAVPELGFPDGGAAVPYVLTKHDHEIVEDAAAGAWARGLSATTSLLRGPTAPEVVAEAEARDVDMVIVGSRGHGPLASALIGSVSLAILKACKRPVLIVRGSSPFHHVDANVQPAVADRAHPGAAAIAR